MSIYVGGMENAFFQNLSITPLECAIESQCIKKTSNYGLGSSPSIHYAPLFEM